MKSALLLLAAAALTVGGLLAASYGIPDEAQAAEQKPAKLLRHMVLYKFKAEATAAQVQEVIDSFAGLPSKIDAIVDFEHGENVSAEGKSEGLTHCFVVTFRDEKGRETYLAHPAHQAYVEVVRDRREKVIVFDYWTP
jgi:hypothetical protein